MKNVLPKPFIKLQMLRYDESATDADLDAFVATLKHQEFTHKDVTRCYSIYMRNEYHKNKDNPNHEIEVLGRMRAGGKRIPVRWSEQETDALRSGVAKLGKGNWAKIIDMYPDIFGPTARTGRDLKKKWISLENKNNTKPKNEIPPTVYVSIPQAIQDSP